ncbi:DedA-like membrane protein [Amycolatopsis mediterranei S699]|uniref:DedA-like membrane protein n=2 Tax=Amycolatopsis mediterranei TaxID=33910 RepID=A0A0H3DMB0_AMYMU|nr:DedA family protein [Amycolatopsis mediterranei]ADJ50819.1 DedA-like membrane protein [Amycolatopsis mediterranei U32]AEK47831.1 membrane-associated protein [Amycolatopsis mediterranei S699]AFO82525.1 DedA-like membrane protein [Amycolatopsis mediterranei S699]AGT89654.1 DedA-like membrane protein [Amycolatopsis mediterranei RB]KDO12187.1 membrane protein [Amycolatopsis mediterranei]
MNVVSIEAAGVGVSWLDTAGPLLVWVIVLSFVLVECALIVGLFLPGDSLLFGAGVVLAQHGSDANAWFLSGAALIVAVLGNQIGYFIGRKSGTKLIARRDGKVLNRHNLERAQRFLDRRGFFAIVAARWIPWIRTLAPLIAGAARMDQRRFLVATTLGGLLWVPTLVLLGYYGAGLLNVLPWLKTAALWLSIAFFVFGTGYGVLRYRQEMRRPVDAPDDSNARA